MNVFCHHRESEPGAGSSFKDFNDAYTPWRVTKLKGDGVRRLSAEEAKAVLE